MRQRGLINWWVIHVCKFLEKKDQKRDATKGKREGDPKKIRVCDNKREKL